MMAYPCLAEGERLKRIKKVASVSGEVGWIFME
jgi:hypothetical protein